MKGRRTEDGGRKAEDGEFTVEYGVEGGQAFLIVVVVLCEEGSGASSFLQRWVGG